VEDVVRRRIDGGLQPEAFVIDLNHGLIQRNVIRRFPARGLSVGLLDPIVDRLRLRLTLNFSSSEMVFESDSPARCRQILSCINRRGVRSRSTKSTSIQSLAPLKRANSGTNPRKVGRLIRRS